jgi:hypothetical protein
LTEDFIEAWDESGIRISILVEFRGKGEYQEKRVDPHWKFIPKQVVSVPGKVWRIQVVKKRATTRSLGRIRNPLDHPSSEGGKIARI